MTLYGEKEGFTGFPDSPINTSDLEKGTQNTTVPLFVKRV